MRITLDISDRRITDLLHGHSGNHSPWMRGLSGKWDGKRGATVRFDREEDNEGDGKGVKTIRRPHVLQGLRIMAMTCPNRFADFLEESDDDLAFDVAWQCILFGKIIYG